MTNVVYGYLVASDALGDAYVVSMDDTLQNIRSTLGADSVMIYQEGTVACAQPLSEGNQAELKPLDADLTEPELPPKFDHESRIPDSGYASKMPSLPASPTCILGTPPGPRPARVLFHREDRLIRMRREDIVIGVGGDDISSTSSEDDRSAYPANRVPTERPQKRPRTRSPPVRQTVRKSARLQEREGRRTQT
jgi:hypothetical protein